jgi:hypothetical protein
MRRSRRRGERGVCRGGIPVAEVDRQAARAPRTLFSLEELVWSVLQSG